MHRHQNQGYRQFSFTRGKGTTLRLLRVMTHILLSLTLGLLPALPAQASSRIKDIVSFEGVRDNMLVGYGLVVGLDGTGDSLRNSPFTKQSLEAMLERLGVNTRAAEMKTQNVAAVMVTADIGAFTRRGTRIDVTVSSMGDAKSLRGGTLLVTPLLGADGEAYAVAQGSVQIAGFSAKGDAASVTQGVSTGGRIPNGAITEREIPYVLASQNSIRLQLHNPDFTTAARVAAVINQSIGGGIADALDPATVLISRPADSGQNMTALLTSIEQLEVSPDQRARVVIDERSGIIVIGADVRVSEVAIAQGNLTISITETPQVSQPAPFSQGGTTTTVPRTDISVDDGKGKKLVMLKSGISLQQLVDGLNALGVGPRDMIAILEALKAAGALQAEIEVL
jgi:flagellar P-ring protein precursor FlgI